MVHWSKVARVASFKKKQQTFSTGTLRQPGLLHSSNNNIFLFSIIGFKFCLIFNFQPTETLDERQSKLRRIPGYEFRPFIATNAISFEEAPEFFVVLDVTTIPEESFFHGLETAFKLQAVFKNVKFDDSTAYIWNVLDRIVFKLNIFQKPSTRVSKIVTDLE